MSSVDILVPDLPESVADATVATAQNRATRSSVTKFWSKSKLTKWYWKYRHQRTAFWMQCWKTRAPPSCLARSGRLREGNSAGKESSEKADAKASTPAQRQQASLEEQNNDALSPAIRRLLAEHNLDPAAIKGTGVGGRLTREDVEKHLAKAPAPAEAKAPAAAPAAAPAPQLGHRSEKRVPMTRLRKRVAERLLEAKNSTAMLTTFNEVNMKPIMDLRKQYGEAFENVMASAGLYVLLRESGSGSAETLSGSERFHRWRRRGVPQLLRRQHGRIHSARSGHPVLRDVDLLGMADIEKNIKELAVKGRDGKLTVDDLTGGNFTITNGGVFGSLMSTPIINPPQSAILGMHAIKDRPMAVNGKRSCR